MIQLLNRTSNNSSLLADSHVAWPYPAVPQMSRHYYDDDHARGVYPMLYCWSQFLRSESLCGAYRER